MIYAYFFENVTVRMHSPHCKRVRGACGPTSHSDDTPGKLAHRGTNLFLTCRSVKQEAEDIFFQHAQFRPRCCFPSRLRIQNGSRGCSDVAYHYLKQAAMFQQSQQRVKSRYTSFKHNEVIFASGFKSVAVATLLQMPLCSGNDHRWWSLSYVDGISNMIGKAEIFEFLKTASLGIFKLSFYLDLGRHNKSGMYQGKMVSWKPHLPC